MSEWVKLTAQETTSVGKNAREGEPLVLLVQTLWRFLQMLKVELTYDPGTAPLVFTQRIQTQI